MKRVAVLLSLGVFLTVSCETMKEGQEAQVSDVSFTPCQQTKAATNEPADSRVVVEFTNDGVKITYYHFEVTCDFNVVKVSHTFVNGFLNITQKGSPDQAKCICFSDVSYMIKGLSQKDVNVIFINGIQVYCYNGNEQKEGYVTFGANYHVINCLSTVTVFLDGENIGVLQKPVDFINDCGEAWNLNRKISIGLHTYRVEIRGGCGSKDIAGTFKVSENECVKIFIDYHQIFNPQPNIKEGIYFGTYSLPLSSWSGDYGRKVTLELINGRFKCTDYSDPSGARPSANGAGTYSIKNDTIIFRDELIRCDATPVCDPILIGKYHYAFDGKRLKLFNGRYIFDLELVDTGGCDQNVIISAAEYENSPNHPVSVIETRIEGNCLKIKIGASGCSGMNWIVKLIDSGDIEYSNITLYPPSPPKRTLRLSLKDIGVCAAWFTNEISFNIEDLQIPRISKVLLDISGKSILYEY